MDTFADGVLCFFFIADDIVVSDIQSVVVTSVHTAYTGTCNYFTISLG